MGQEQNAKHLSLGLESGVTPDSDVSCLDFVTNTVQVLICLILPSMWQTAWLD